MTTNDMAEDRTYLLRSRGPLDQARARFSLFRGQLARNLRAACATPGALQARRRAQPFFVEATTDADPLTGCSGSSPSRRSSTGRGRPRPVRAGEEPLPRPCASVPSRSAPQPRPRSGRGTSEKLERALGAPCSHARKVDLERSEVTASIELDWESPTSSATWCREPPGSRSAPKDACSRWCRRHRLGGGVRLLLKRGAQVDYLFYNLGGSDHENQVLEVIQVLVRRWSYGLSAQPLALRPAAVGRRPAPAHARATVAGRAQAADA